MSIADTTGGAASVKRARRRRLVVAALAAAGLIVAAALFWFVGPSAPAPPALDLQGADPLIVRAVEDAAQQVRRAPRSAESWARLGAVLVVHDYFADGRTCLAQAERLEPSAAAWTYRSALGALAAADGEAALDKLERTIALGGDLGDGPRLRLAELLTSMDRWDDAAAHLRQLLREQPKHARAHLGLARLACRRGDPQAGLESLGIAQADPRTQKAALLLAVEAQRGLGNAAAADQAHRQASALPDDPPWPDPVYEAMSALRTGKAAWLDEARTMSSRGQDSKALDALYRAVAEYPDDVDAWLMMGKVYLLQKNPLAAEQALRHAVELAPENPEGVFYLGSALAMRGELLKAIDCFQSAIKRKPDFAPAHHLLGNCLAHLGKAEEAIAAYRDAVRFNPALFDVHSRMAKLYAERGQTEGAIRHAAAAVQLRPDDAAARRQLEALQATGLRPSDR